MMQSVVIQRIDQCLKNMLLPGHFGKNAGTPFAGKNLITHSSTTLNSKKHYREISGALEGALTNQLSMSDMAVTPTSHTSAHSVTTTVAPFRAWRGSRLAVARGPVGVTIKTKRAIIGGLSSKCNKCWR
jgi:hypothetical protein